jgi:hypothetical protein
MNELTNKFWDEHFRNKNRSELPKIKQRIYDWLNQDNFGGFGVDGKIFWIETVCTSSIIYNYIRDYIIKWCKTQGYSYLYNIKKDEMSKEVKEYLTIE